eukprot:PITA_11273
MKKLPLGDKRPFLGPLEQRMALSPSLHEDSLFQLSRALDASGRSGGLAIGVNNRTAEVRKYFGGRSFIGLDISSHLVERDIRIINVCGPCTDRANFWRILLGSELFQADNIILGGDLNFSLGFSESWKHLSQVDSLTDTMTSLLEDHKWVDIPSARLQYTWSNNRSGEQSLARRLDRFLIKEPLYKNFPRIRQWVGSGGIFDHRPIFLEAEDTSHKVKSPFKFNVSWLLDPSYIQLVHNYWRTNPIRDDEDISVGFEYTSLITKRSQILKEREESWRLRSRAIWLLEGDANTKFYHKFANGRKIINTIWELKNEHGQQVSSQKNLARLATEHFCGIYKAPADVNILEIMRMAEHFPRFIEQEDSEELLKEVTMAELEATLKWFQKDKSPGPDGWTIEFYLAFVDLLGNDLLKIVEDSRRRGRISSAIKLTFIALIPKSNAPNTFDEFHPISLCNYLYKIIAKTIANRLKPILSHHISSEQFAFLHRKQIHEAIASAQELLHTLQVKKQKGMILKVDLSKAFDRTNWLYLRLLLTHPGFPYNFIKWTMSCITDVSYSVLLNGEANTFFTSERGLRQGCPLSPLLFLLIMEGLSRVISAARDRQLLNGIKLADNFYLTHLLFVDDILIFLNGSIGDTTTLQNSMLLFQRATGMRINEQKSTITLVGCSIHETVYATQCFPFNSLPLADGIKYLGFRLKPNGYRIADWLWLIAIVEKRLQVWYHRYLSLAGRLILIKAVIEATPVYWMALTWIPKGILNRLQHICSRFLWAGQQTGRLFGWVKWDTIAKPKSWGGWGIKRLHLFSKALAAKLGWKLLTSEGLWTRVAYAKYIKPLNVLDWFFSQQNTHNVSITWKAVINTIPLLRDGLTWRIREGNSVRIGLDPWAWLSAHTLEIPAQWQAAWTDYTDALTQAHIRLTEGPDEIIWAFAKHGAYAPNLGYLKLIEPIRPLNIHPTWKALWKLKSPPCTRLLMWNILFDKIPMGTNLMKRSFHGPFRYHLCHAEEESTNHLFLNCNVTLQFWNSLISHFPHLRNW